MMTTLRILAVGLVLAASTLPAPEASAEDLTYRYRPSQLGVLRGYNNQPYWAILAECAGIYGALANRYEEVGPREAVPAATKEGLGFLNASLAQLMRDRGIARSDALKLVTDRVEAGRASGLGMLAEPPKPRGPTHEQVVDVFCRQIGEAHTSALRFAR